MASQFAISPAEDDAVIRQRLLTRTTVTRGEPPLKKLIKRFTHFFQEAERAASTPADVERAARLALAELAGFEVPSINQREGSAGAELAGVELLSATQRPVGGAKEGSQREGSGNADVDRAARLALAELAGFELPLVKTAAVKLANEREQKAFQDLQKDLERQIEQARAEIDEHVRELEVARMERKHKEECEAIRRLICTFPPRRQTDGQIAALKEDHSLLESQNQLAARTLDLRKKQFALLLHAVEELQSAIAADGGRFDGQDDDADSPAQAMDHT